MKKISFIVNPISGTSTRRKNIEQLVDQYLDKNKYQSEILYTEYAGHAVPLTQLAIQNGANVIVAVGGDGSVNEVAASLIGTDVIFGILPAGSGNGFAMHMGIGRNIIKAIKILNTGQVQTIDTITLNDKALVNISGVGFTAHVAHEFKQSKTRGFWNYLKIALSLAYHAPFHRYKASIDHQDFIERECLTLEVANASYFGYQFQPAPLAKTDDGLLELIFLNKAPKYKYFLHALRMLNGKINQSYFVERIPCKEVKIKIPKGSFVHIDGEGFIENSDTLHYKIVPLSLKIIAPGT